MRLIDTKTREVKVFDTHNSVAYAILSHRWEEDEVMLQDLTRPGVEQKKGYEKIKFACAEALRSGLSYVWMDTCCIDKTSSAELSEAINSMYMWYEAARVCYAYLSDIESVNDLENSLWFTRGWTLQELIAPRHLQFFGKHWRCFGSKSGLQQRISKKTGIPVPMLLHDRKPSDYTIGQRMSWASARSTTRPEDSAYCLMGLFDVNMPMIYGESSKAFIRLQEEIIKTSDDQSVFAWSSSGRRGILAPSPACFAHSANLVPVLQSLSVEKDLSAPPGYSMTNAGLSIRLLLLPWTANIYIAVLPLYEERNTSHIQARAETVRFGILLRRTDKDRQYVRVALDGKDTVMLDLSKYESAARRVDALILKYAGFFPDLFYGFRFNLNAHQWGHTFLSPYSSIVSRKTPTDYQLITKHENIDENLDESPLVAVPSGVQGIVVTFHLSRSSEILREASHALTNTMGEISFGFDFDFNPICIIDRQNNFSQQDCSASTGLPGCDAIERYVAKYESMSHDLSWSEHGIVVLTADRIRGLDVRIKTLNLHVLFRKEWMDGGGKVWGVTFS